MNGDLIKHMTKNPFYSVDYFSGGELYADAPALINDIEEVLKYTSSIFVEMYDGKEYCVESVKHLVRLVEYFENKMDCTPLVDSFRFRLNETNQTWFDLSHNPRVIKKELPA